MDIEDIRAGLIRAQRIQNAAFLVLEGRMKEFMAAQEVGSAKEREEARTACMAAHEAYLDAIDAAWWWHHKAHGIDPDNRG